MRRMYLSGDVFDAHVARVKWFVQMVERARQHPWERRPLRHERAIEQIHAAQAWLTRLPLPKHAWQTRRVLRTAIRLGRDMPLLEGEHPNIPDTCMLYNFLTDDFAVFPSVIARCSTTRIAGMLVHEATHLVHRQVLCERYQLTFDEALVYCNSNEREVTRTIFMTEALAHWNEACLLLAVSPAERAADSRRARLERHELLDAATRMIRGRTNAVKPFADLLLRYTYLQTARRTPSPIDVPFIGLFGKYAGRLIDQSNLAPHILKPLIKAART